MRMLILGLMTCAVADVSCRKVDSSSSGPSAPGAPSTEALAPGFKNSAKNSSEVGSKLQSFSSSSKTSMSLPVSAPSSTSSPLAKDSIAQLASINLSSMRGLTSAALTSSENDEDSASDIGLIGVLMDIEVDGDCGAAMKKLSTLYDKKYSQLRSYADDAVSYDGKLPQGVTKGAATDQYATVYNLSGEEGQAALGFGANSEKAVVGLTFVGQITDSDDKKINATGDFLYVATIAQKKLEQSVVLNTEKGSVKVVSTTIGGDTPSMQLTEDISLEAGKASASVKITKTGVNEMQIDGSETKDGVVTNSSLKLSVDKNGKCVSAKK